MTSGLSYLRVRSHGRTEDRSARYTPSVQHLPSPLVRSAQSFSASSIRSRCRASRGFTRAMAFEVSGMDMTTMTYEPLAIPSQYTEISDTQAWSIYRKFEVWPKIIRRYEWGGIWAGSTCRRQCRHALRTRSITSTRRGMSQIDEVCKPSDRRCSVQGG